MRFFTLLIFILLCAMVATSSLLPGQRSDEQRLTAALMDCMKWIAIGKPSPTTPLILNQLPAEQWITVLNANNTSGKKDGEFCYEEKMGAWMTSENGTETAPHIPKIVNLPSSQFPGKLQISLVVAPHSAFKSARVSPGTRVVIQQSTLNCGKFNFKTPHFQRMEWDEFDNVTEISFTTGNYSACCEKDVEASQETLGWLCNSGIAWNSNFAASLLPMIVGVLLGWVL